MRAPALVVGLSCASIVCSTLCGCSWKKLFPAEATTLPNAVAVDRALRLCSLSEGDQPFHLILDISPPAGVISPAAAPSRSATPQPPLDPAQAQMHATIELFWLNAITYRTEIQSPSFRQTRIVNGNFVDERDIGDYYPRWIQDFVQGILNPVPEAPHLRRVPGEVPISLQSEACISTPAGNPAPATSLDSAQLCFRNAEPLLAGITNARRSLWFDDYDAFGSQQIARTIVDNLQPNLLLHGRIIRLEPLPHSRYSLLKVTRFTPHAQQLATSTVSTAMAQTLLLPSRFAYGIRSAAYVPQSIAPSPELTGSAVTGVPASENQPAIGQTPIYIRTDRTGRVREAYRSPSDHFGIEKAALVRALTLRFKPLIVDRAPRQMETLIYLPAGDPSARADLSSGSPWPRSPRHRSPQPHSWITSPSIARSSPGFAYSTRPTRARPALTETQTQIPSPATAPQTSGPDQAAAPAPLPPEKNRH